MKTVIFTPFKPSWVTDEKNYVLGISKFSEQVISMQYEYNFLNFIKKSNEEIVLSL